MSFFRSFCKNVQKQGTAIELMEVRLNSILRSKLNNSLRPGEEGPYFLTFKLDSESFSALSYSGSNFDKGTYTKMHNCVPFLVVH